MTLQPPEAPLPLETFAVLSAEMDAGHPPAEVLDRENLTEDQWGSAKRYWLEQMAAEAKRNKFEVSTRYTTLFKAHRAISAAKLGSTLPRTAKSTDPSKSIEGLDVLASDAPPTSEEAPDTTSSPGEQPGGSKNHFFDTPAGEAKPPPLVSAPANLDANLPKPVQPPVIRELQPHTAGPPSDPVPSTNPMPSRFGDNFSTPWDASRSSGQVVPSAPPVSPPDVVLNQEHRPSATLRPLEESDDDDDGGGTVVTEAFPQGDTLPFRSRAGALAPEDGDIPTLAVQVTSPLSPPANRGALHGTPFQHSALPFREASVDGKPQTSPGPSPLELGHTTAEVPSPVASRKALPFESDGSGHGRASSSVTTAFSSTMLEAAASARPATPFESNVANADPRKPVPTPESAGTQLTLQHFASLTAELAESPDRATEIRARYKLDLPAHRGEANRWRTHFEQVKGSAEQFAALVNQYRAYIRQRSSK